MPYGPSGTFTLINGFGDATPPNNQFPPQVGANLTDIASAISAGGTNNPYLRIAQNLADLNNVVTARTNLGLGTAAVLDSGTAVGNVVTMAAGPKLPAVDGSQLTNLPAQSGRVVAGTPLVLNPWALSATVTQAHGLGVSPSFFKFELQCLTADLGYSVGDIIVINNTLFYSTLTVDATNVVLTTSATSVQFANKSTHAVGTPTPASWKLTVTPYKLV